MKPRLIRPSPKYRASYLLALREFQREGLERNKNYRKLASNFAEYVHRELGKAQGKYLAVGYVPDSVFWLVRGKEYLGRLSLRHRLTKRLLAWGGHIGYRIRPSERRKGYGTAILRLGLGKARTLGLKRVLLTCNETNVGSRKIIEANGGQFKSKYKPAHEPMKLRFWIDLYPKEKVKPAPRKVTL